MSDNNKYTIDDETKQTLGSLIRELKPVKKNTLTSIVYDIRQDIETARNNGVSWDEIAQSFNKLLGFEGNDEISGNSLSQVYVTVRKRVEESRKGVKPSYEELEKRVKDLERENEKLKKELERTQKK